jgi:hypothetical protein
MTTNIDALADALVSASIEMNDAIRAAGRKPEDNRHAVRLGDLAEVALRIAAGDGRRAEALLRLDRDRPRVGA